MPSLKESDFENRPISEKLKNLPDSPGVYQFRNELGKVLYVGKAINLRNRVRSYFQNKNNSARILTMVRKVHDVELIITGNEIEALVLENNLIKKLKPRYNVNLKDDKTYPYIKVTNEPYPRIYPTRKLYKDGSKYYGPYTDVKSMKGALRIINQLFRIRSCKLALNELSISQGKFKVCLDYHIKKCDGPCAGYQTEHDYNEMVQQVTKLLRGRTEELIRDFRNRMNHAAENLEFEHAAEYRDKIEKLSAFNEKQKVVVNDDTDRDIIAAVSEGREACCSILNIRNGKLIGKKDLNLSVSEGEDAGSIYAGIIKQFYANQPELPQEIVTETAPDDAEVISEWLRLKAERKITLTVPQRGELKALVQMCSENARLRLKELQLQKSKKEGDISYSVIALQRDLYLKKPPVRIECFDISNIQGSDSVSGMVVFENGKPKRSDYRKFIIKSVDGPNDFASMKEVITRRYSKIKEAGEKLPELIMVDGGKGQLSSAVEALDELGLTNYNIIGLAKRLEEVFIPHQSDPLNIPKVSSGLKLLQQVRDETHRFSITFHRSRRDKRTLRTELTDIPGIGEKIAIKLLLEIGSVEKIKDSTPEEIARVIGAKKGEIVYRHYHPETLPAPSGEKPGEME
ncbi:MAG: excinuclease ABC subunit UvrC [Ignavibacteriaceae bacterium]|nr:excinuclease ABC subunit UvrC [Ignavibacteriaceae bacterium]